MVTFVFLIFFGLFFGSLFVFAINSVINFDLVRFLGWVLMFMLNYALLSNNIGRGDNS